MTRPNLTRPRSARSLLLAGGLSIDESGNFKLALAGIGGIAPPEPEPPDPIPDDVIVITPTGGDDAGLIQDKINGLAAGYALMLSGMFNVKSTIYFHGDSKTLMGDPAKQSGLRVAADSYGGPYGSLLSTTPDLTRSRIVGLEIDGGNKRVQTVFFDCGEDNSIEDCYIHDIQHSQSGPPYAAIHSQNYTNLSVLRNRIERTTGVDGGEGVRGIWIPGRGGAWVEGNHTKDTGHTGIAVEGSTATVINNSVENSLTQGTGYKICYRGANVYKRRRALPKEAGIYFANNSCRSTKGAGIMLENCNAVGVLIEKSSFTECGAGGTTFGAFYSTSQANAFEFRDNHLENCRSVGGFRSLSDSSFDNNSISGGSNVIWLEDNCHRITVNRSGQVNVGSNVSDVTVDGVKVA